MAGPLGCFVVWRRMSYIGDTLAHSALLGVSLGIFFNLDLNIATATVAMGIAFLLGILGCRAHLSLDALLGILSHSTFRRHTFCGCKRPLNYLLKCGNHLDIAWILLEITIKHYC